MQKSFMKNSLSDIKYVVVGAFFVLCSAFSHGEQTLETAEYIVHYNAFNSTAIDSQAAKKNQLVRSRYSAMINIAVFKKGLAGGTQAVSSFNSGTVKNLLGQQQSLTFTTISEGKAIYYIASFRFADEDQMDFNVLVQPDPNKEPMSIKLSQKFYTQ